MKLSKVSVWVSISIGASAVVPRLSAAMTTPSLNFAANTEVPVTIGA